MEVNKNTNIVSLATLGIVILQAVWVFGYRDAEIEGRFNEANAHRKVIESKVGLLTDDRVHKATVDQMFVNRDMQITELKDRLERIDTRIAATNSRIQATNDLIAQLLKEMRGK